MGGGGGGEQKAPTHYIRYVLAGERKRRKGGQRKGGARRKRKPKKGEAPQGIDRGSPLLSDESRSKKLAVGEDAHKIENAKTGRPEFKVTLNLFLT